MSQGQMTRVIVSIDGCHPFDGARHLGDLSAQRYIWDMMKKQILLTGASGEVGFEAFKELLRREDHYKIRILSLDHPVERKLFKPYLDQVDIVWGDLRNPDDVRQAVAGVDAVLHIAALIPPLADHQPELAWQVNVGGTRSLLAAMQAQNPAPRLIYTSSISVYGDRLANPDIRVGDPLIPSDGDEYAKTKIEAEQLIQNSSLQWTILRLCGILTKNLKIQPLMFHMPLNTALEWCHACDAGYALVQALENDFVCGEIFNLGGGKQCRVSAREFIEEVLPLYGLERSVLPEHAFAIQNFHSGNYIDGDELEHLLKFRRKTLIDYYDTASLRVSPVQRFLVGRIPKAIVRNYLARISEPLKSIRENNARLIERYYGSRQIFEKLVRGEGVS
mgnify:CR=1 FL=1